MFSSPPPFSLVQLTQNNTQSAHQVSQKIPDEKKISKKRKNPDEALQSECNKAQLALAHAQLRIGELEANQSRAQEEIESSKEAIEILREDKRKLQQSEKMLRDKMILFSHELKKAQEENNILKIHMPQIIFQSVFNTLHVAATGASSGYSSARFYQPPPESKVHIEVIETNDEVNPNGSAPLPKRSR